MDWGVVQPAITTAVAAYEATLVFLSDPLWRFLGLVVVVLITIAAIAQVYSGDLQNAEKGPVAIRPHSATRANLSGIVMPKDLGVPFTMDGVSTNVSFFYVYDDARNKRRKIKLLTREMSLAIQPYRLGKVQNIIYGHEVPDVPQESVCYPPFSIDQTPEIIGKTPERAPEYVEVNKIQDAWTDDDNAVLVSVTKSLHEELDAKRNAFITEHVAAWTKARDGGYWSRGRMRQLAKHRPNVIGSYYIQFKFKSDPLFVLFRHPDRELKMTAWLTVLTSAFALLMDAWPKPALSASADAPPRAEAIDSSGARGVVRAP